MCMRHFFLLMIYFDIPFLFVPLFPLSGRFYRYAMQEVANTQTYIHNKLVADVTALETALIGMCAIFTFSSH